MLSAARKLAFWQDVPLLFLAWLVPSTLLLLLTTPQNLPRLPLSNTDFTGLARLHDLAAVPAPAEAFAYFIWPLLLLGALILGLACCSSQLMDKRGTLISLAYCTLSLSILPQFTPGNTAFGALQLVLLISLLGFCLTARHAPKLAGGAGFCAAALLVMGPHTAAFGVISAVWIAVGWALRSREQGDASVTKSTYFGYSFASGTIIFGALFTPDFFTISTGCSPFTVAHAAPAVLSGAGLAYLANSTHEFQTRRQRLYSVGLLFFISFAGLLALAPACVLSPLSGTGSGLLTLIMREPVSAYALMTTPALGLIAAALATFQGGRHQNEWALLLASLCVACLLMVFDAKLSILANTLAIVPCAWVTLDLGRRSRSSRPSLLAGLAFVAIWLAGMNLTHTFIAGQITANAADHQRQPIRISAYLPCTEAAPAVLGDGEVILLSKGKQPCR